jgi:hypothetical protein
MNRNFSLMCVTVLTILIFFFFDYFLLIFFFSSISLYSFHYHRFLLSLLLSLTPFPPHPDRNHRYDVQTGGHAVHMRRYALHCTPHCTSRYYFFEEILACCIAQSVMHCTLTTASSGLPQVSHTQSINFSTSIPLPPTSLSLPPTSFSLPLSLSLTLQPSNLLPLPLPHFLFLSS